MFKHGGPNWPWWRAVGTLIGGVVGVGVFGIPYAFAQSGFLIGLIELVIVGGLLLALQLMFAEVAVQTPGRHRISGYVGKYLGRGVGNIASVLFIASACGAMLAFMIIGGGFLHTLFSPMIGGDPFWYSMAVYLAVAAYTFRGIMQLARIHLFVVIGQLFLFGFLVLAALPQFHIQNLTVVHPEHWFVPYGVLFFALSGLGLVPEMKDVLGGQMRHLPQTIVVGMTVIIALYALFGTVLLAATGEGTTEMALDGLSVVLGPSFALIASVLGSLNVLSVFSLLATEVQSTLTFDYKIPLRKAWGLTLVVPLLLFLFGVREFIELIGFIGAVFGGCIGIIVILTYEKMRRSPVCTRTECFRLPSIISWLIVFVFIGGVVEALRGLFL